MRPKDWRKEGESYVLSYKKWVKPLNFSEQALDYADIFPPFFILLLYTYTLKVQLTLKRKWP